MSSSTTASNDVKINDGSKLVVFLEDQTWASLDLDGTLAFTLSTITVTSGTSDVDGILAISHIFDADGTFDATNGEVQFPASGSSLILSSTVTSLGTLQNDQGTVKYDGTSAQTVHANNYYNLTIENAITKTAGGNLDVDGDLTTEAEASCVLDLAAYDLNLAGNLTVGQEGGLDASDASCAITFDGSTTTVTHAGSTENSVEDSDGTNTTDYPIPDNGYPGSYASSTIVLSNSLTTDDLVSVTVNISYLHWRSSFNINCT